MCPWKVPKSQNYTLKFVSIYLSAMNISLDEEIQKDKEANKQNTSHGYSQKVNRSWFRYSNLDK